MAGSGLNQRGKAELSNIVGQNHETLVSKRASLAKQLGIERK